MPDATRLPVAELLRRAGYDLPPAVLADLGHAHALLEAMLTRLVPPAPEAEPATIFRAETPR